LAAVVPEGGEARVQRRVDPPETDGATMTTLEKSAADLDDIGRQIDAIAKSPETDRKRRAEEIERLRSGVEAMRARTAPGRDVVVRGLPADAASRVLRLVTDGGRNWFWRARIEGGTARFAQGPAGRYIVRLEPPVDTT